MKKFLFILLIFIPFSVISQSSVKIFAYSQTETPGIIPKGVLDENGNSVRIKKEPHVKYYIFAKYPTPGIINFTEIWIKGNLYSLKTQIIDSTPVLNITKDINERPVKMVLVPFTKLRVVSIIPLNTISNSLIRRSWFRKMTTHNELIVSYRYNGKKYFIGVKKIIVLQPISNL